MKDYLLKIKVKQTLYFDYDGDGWIDDNPKSYSSSNHYRLYEHYELMRKGTVLYFYNCEEDEEFDFEGRLKNNFPKIKFNTIEDILNCSWFEILENNIKE